MTGEIERVREEGGKYEVSTERRYRVKRINYINHVFVWKKERCIHVFRLTFTYYHNIQHIS